MPSISIPLAFLAGVLSFASPCVLPLVPVYLSYLSGNTLAEDATYDRRLVFSHALAFVGGFTLTFLILFGLPATILSSALHRYGDWISRIGGAILILFGIHTMGIVTIPAFAMTRQVAIGTRRQPGYVRSVLFGVTFAAGWTPCIGPLLGTVMTLALTTPSRAMGFFLVYALGLAIPFLAAAALLAQISGWLKRLNRHARAVEIVSGLLMAGVGVLLVTGTLSALNNAFIRITPEWMLQLM